LYCSFNAQNYSYLLNRLGFYFVRRTVLSNMGQIDTLIAQNLCLLVRSFCLATKCECCFEQGSVDWQERRILIQSHFIPSNWPLALTNGIHALLSCPLICC
jgi:hypothetical protein